MAVRVCLITSCSTEIERDILLLGRTVLIDVLRVDGKWSHHSCSRHMFWFSSAKIDSSFFTSSSRYWVSIRGAVITVRTRKIEEFECTVRTWK